MMEGSAGYRPLLSDESEEPKSTFQSDDSISHRLHPRKSLSTIAWIFIVQGLNLVCLSAILWWVVSGHSCHPAISKASDQYDRLSDYNSLVTFTSNPELVFPTEENDHYWRQGLRPKGDGVVILQDDWATAREIPPSGPSPPIYSHPKSSIYQVDVFHQLHCLQVIRERLNHPNDPHFAPNAVGFNHTTHCVDWIRQSLMCNADVTLGTTEDYLDFGFGNAHKCKDFGAITEWALENRFLEHADLILLREGDN